MGMIEISATIADAARKLRLMRRGTETIENKISRLQDERAVASPARKTAITREIRELTIEKLAADELVDAAADRSADAALAFRKAEDAAVKNLHQIGSDAVAAAQRLDRALAEARAAAEEVERLCEPLHLTLLPSGAIRRALGRQSIDRAVVAAFGDRFGRSAAYSEKRRFVDTVRLMIGDAHENAGRIRKNEEIQR